MGEQHSTGCGRWPFSTSPALESGHFGTPVVGFTSGQPPDWLKITLWGFPIHRTIPGLSHTRCWGRQPQGSEHQGEEQGRVIDTPPPPQPPSHPGGRARLQRPWCRTRLTGVVGGRGAHRNESTCGKCLQCSPTLRGLWIGARTHYGYSK